MTEKSISMNQRQFSAYVDETMRLPASMRDERLNDLPSIDVTDADEFFARRDKERKVFEAMEALERAIEELMK